jgi:PAS domain S-box-containing protein
MEPCVTDPLVKVLCLWSSVQCLAIVSKVLEQDGQPFDLITAESLTAFRQQSESNEFDAALIDYRSLPGRAKERREFLESLDPYLPLVLLVSERDEENALRILKGGGAQDYVVKSLPQLERLPFALRSAASQRAESSGQQALQTAKDIEHRLLAFLENSADAIVVVGEAGEIKFKTDAVARVLGYSVEEMMAGTIFDLVHPEDIGAILQIFSGLTQVAGASSRGEIRLRAKGGSWHWIEATAKNLFDDPQVAGIVVNYRDIHERKQAEILQDAVYRIAQAADFALSLNELFPRIHAIISEVMPASNFYIGLAGSTRGYLSFPYFMDEVDNAPVGEQSENGLTEYVLRTGKSLVCDEKQQQDMALHGEVDDVGALSKVWLGVPLIVDGSAIGVMVVQHYHDSRAYGEREQRMLEFVSSQVALVIKKKQTEQALRASEERFRSLFENSTVGITRTTPEGRVLLANPALIKMLRFDSLEELQGRNLQTEGFALEHPRSEFHDLIDAGGELHGYESTWICKDGSFIYVRESMRAVRSQDGRILYYEGIVEDITAQKRASLSLQDKVAALQALAEIDRDILAARDATDILELVCRSAASLLKTPMAAIVSTRTGDWKLEATFGIASPEAVSVELREMVSKGMSIRPVSFSMEAVSANSSLIPQFLNQEGVRAVLAENLAIVGEIQRGVLLVFDTMPRAWVEDDISLLKALAGQAAIALEKARLLSEAERRGDEFAALYNFSSGLSGERDVGAILALIVDSVIQ